MLMFPCGAHPTQWANGSSTFSHRVVKEVTSTTIKRQQHSARQCLCSSNITTTSLIMDGKSCNGYSSMQAGECGIDDLTRTKQSWKCMRRKAAVMEGSALKCFCTTPLMMDSACGHVELQKPIRSSPITNGAIRNINKHTSFIFSFNPRQIFLGGFWNGLLILRLQHSKDKEW